MPAYNEGGEEKVSQFGEKTITRRKAGTVNQLPKDGTGAKSQDIINPTVGNQPSFPGDYEVHECSLKSPHKPGGGIIDLRNSWSELNIFEDMFSSTLTCDITIVDGVGLTEFLPIIGEETLTIKIKTSNLTNQRPTQIGEPSGPPGSPIVEYGPFNESENTGFLDLVFTIFKMADRSNPVVGGMSTYTLHGVSQEYVDNLKIKVQRSTINGVTGEPQKISNVVRSLYTEYVKPNSKTSANTPKKIFIEPTQSLVDLSLPNLTPFKTFEFLAGRSVSAGQHASGSNFVFFETVTGYHFISIETLFAGGGAGYLKPPDFPAGKSPDEGMYAFGDVRAKETYTVWPKRMDLDVELENAVLAPERVALEMTSVLSYNFTSNFDVLENLTKGMYANKLMTHDLVRMKFDTIDFSYLQDQMPDVIVHTDGTREERPIKKTAADKKNFSDSFTHLEDQDLCTSAQSALNAPNALVSFYPTNLGHDQIPHFKDGVGIKTVKHGEELGPLNIVPNRVEEWLQQRTVQQQQLNNIKLNIRAPGRSSRMVGDVINFKMPSPSLSMRGGGDEMEEHKYLSGKYLITKLRHHFSREIYNIEFECIKDSLKASASGGGGRGSGVSGSSAIMDDGSIKMSEDGERVIGGF
jgi:hypothetical protein